MDGSARVRERSRKYQGGNRHSKNLMGNLENAKIVLRGVSNYMTELNQIAGQFSQLKFSKTEFEHVMDMIFPTKQSADAKQIQKIEEKKLAFVNAYSQDDNANFKGKFIYYISKWFISHHLVYVTAM